MSQHPAIADTLAAPRWTSSCPQCGSERVYKNKRDVARGAKRPCRSCARRSYTRPRGYRLKVSPAMEALWAARRGRPATEKQLASLAKGRPGKGEGPWAGKTMSADMRQKMRDAHLRRKTQQGFINSPETRDRLRAAAYVRHGTVPRPGALSRSELGQWAHDVIKRDHGTCVCCGYRKRGRKDVHAHHILSKSKHPELALFTSNGVTLCTSCHRQEHHVNGLI